MPFSLFEASAPVFINSLSDMRAWLGREDVKAREAELLAAKLADDMHPLPRQFQMASDSAKGAVARLAGIEPPSMADTEASFAELQDRCDRTIAFIKSVDPAAIEAGTDRDVTLPLPNNMGFRFKGADFLTRFALPNFLFHVSMGYAILRNQGIPLGKADFLQHLGMPEQL